MRCAFDELYRGTQNCFRPCANFCLFSWCAQKKEGGERRLKNCTSDAHPPAQAKIKGYISPNIGNDKF